MPAYVFAAGSVLEVRYISTYQGQRIMTNLHYALAPGTIGADDGPAFIQACATEFGNVGAGSVAAALLGCQVDTLTLIRCEAQKVSPNRWAKKVQDVNTPGLIAGDGMPSNVAADITRRTEEVRKKGDPNHVGGIGTIHVAAIPRNAVVDNALTADYIGTKLSVLATRLVQTRTVSGKPLVPVLWHRRATVDPFYGQVVDATPEEFSRTMRNRGALRGI